MNTKYQPGDRVTNSRAYDPNRVGVVIKTVAAQGKFKAVAVVDFGDGDNPSTIWQNDLRKAP